MNLNDNAVLPSSKSKSPSGAIFTQSKIEIIKRKVGELEDLVNETFRRLNYSENPELLVEENDSFCPWMDAEFISFDLEMSLKIIQRSTKILDKIETKRRIAQLSKDLEEGRIGCDKSTLDKLKNCRYLKIVSKAEDLKNCKDHLAKLEIEEEKAKIAELSKELEEDRKRYHNYPLCSFFIESKERQLEGSLNSKKKKSKTMNTVMMITSLKVMMT